VCARVGIQMKPCRGGVEPRRGEVWARDGGVQGPRLGEMAMARKEEQHELSPGRREMAGRPNLGRRLWIANESHALLLAS
jgi:hypothetical protein